MWKTNKNMNANLKCNSKKPDHPYEGASFLKRWTFWWVFVFNPISWYTFWHIKIFLSKYVFFLSIFHFPHASRWLKDLFKLGLQRPIENEDIYRTLQEHESTKLSDRFETLWNEERKKKRPHLFTVIRQLYAKKIIGVSILFTAIDAISRYVRACALWYFCDSVFFFYLNVWIGFRFFFFLFRTERFSHSVWAIWWCTSHRQRKIQSPRQIQDSSISMQSASYCVR